MRCIFALALLAGRGLPLSIITLASQKCCQANLSALRSLTEPVAGLIIAHLPTFTYWALARSGHNWLPKLHVTTANQTTSTPTAITPIRIVSHICLNYWDTGIRRYLYMGIIWYRSSTPPALVTCSNPPAKSVVRRRFFLLGACAFVRLLRKRCRGDRFDRSTQAKKECAPITRVVEVAAGVAAPKMHAPASRCCARRCTT